ncbi:MAG: NADH-quinone oxidoreductase subunit C [Deltaproteobacteria bacterium]|nr:NADH-quinone oxidoreductase subunit C [Deltaproteobacteria bacterium]
MTAKEIYERARELCPDGVGDLDEECMDPFFKVDAASLKQLLLALRDDAALKFDVLSDLTALDLPKEDVIQVVYHLYSYGSRTQIVVKVDLDRGAPRIATVEDIWKVANWFEREVFDLFGVLFEGHSDLRRILLPEDWVGYPLRKDFVEQEEYDGISTEREPLVPENMR